MCRFRSSLLFFLHQDDSNRPMKRVSSYSVVFSFLLLDILIFAIFWHFLFILTHTHTHTETQHTLPQAFLSPHLSCSLSCVNLFQCLQCVFLTTAVLQREIFLLRERNHSFHTFFLLFSYSAGESISDTHKKRNLFHL